MGELVIPANSTTSSIMLAHYPATALPPDPAPPCDPSRWVDEPTLVGLVLAAVADLEVSNPEAEAPVRAGSGRSQPMMFTLLTFCYLTGRYGSEQIERLTRNDAAVRYLCANDLPDWTAIRRFRRVNHGMLELCLYEVLKSSWRIRQRASSPLAGGELMSSATREWLTRSAEEHVRRAMLADCMAMDL